MTQGPKLVHFEPFADGWDELRTAEQSREEAIDRALEYAWVGRL
jgi:hypothetical protein